MLNKRIIFQAVVGSQLYGMATPESDVDIRGVCLENALEIYGLNPMDKPYEDDKHDTTIYGLKQFAKLALGSNPNIVEMFFAKNDCINPQDRRIWDLIRDNRLAFISRKVTETFIGYVISQRKRMDTHHDWMTGKPPVKPMPENYGLEIDDDGGAPHWANPYLKNEYDNLLKDYQSYETWKTNRNKKRHQLEVDYGYDTKHASHIVRLLEQVEELHETGVITFPRPEAKLLLEIRKGAWSYDKLIDWMTAKITHIKTVVDPKSVLEIKPKPALVDRLLMDIYMKELIIND